MIPPPQSREYAERALMSMSNAHAFLARYFAEDEGASFYLNAIDACMRGLSLKLLK